LNTHERPIQAVIPTAMAQPANSYRYSPGVIVPAGSDLLFVSGQVGRDAEGQVVLDPERQFVTAFENLRSILEHAGAVMSNVVEITTYHTSMADLALFAEVKARYLDTTPYPAWTGIGVGELALPGLRVEIRATARL